MTTASPFARLEAINNQIASLRAEYNRLLDQLRAEFNGAAAAAGSGAAPAPLAAAAAPRRGRRPGAKPGQKTGARRGRPPRQTAPAAAEAAPAAAEAVPAKSKRGRPRKSGLKGRSRPKSPTGELGPAVHKVLARAGRPLSTAEIMEGLMADKYVFTSSSPKQTLSARVYKLKGLRQTGPGTFTLEEGAAPAPTVA